MNLKLADPALQAVFDAAVTPTALTLSAEKRNRMTTRMIGGLLQYAQAEGSAEHRRQAFNLYMWWWSLQLPGAQDQQLDGRLYER